MEPQRSQRSNPSRLQRVIGAGRAVLGLCVFLPGCRRSADFVLFLEVREATRQMGASRGLACWNPAENLLE